MEDEDGEREAASIIVPYRDREGLEVSEEVTEQFTGSGLELILVEGDNPSLQRNIGLEKASHDTIFFLDDDSIPTGGHFQRGIELLSSDIRAVGGPELGCVDKSLRCKVFYGAYRSSFAMGRSRARYRKEGGRREAGEKDLILSNLAFDRSLLEEVGGLNERLFPNEENELISRIDDSSKIVYDPKMATRSCKSEPIGDFISRFFKYGRGRAAQMMEEMKPSWEHTLPSMFSVYILLSVALAFFSEISPQLLFSPALAYTLIGVAEGVKNSIEGDYAYILSVALYPIIHLSYGVGMITGFFLPYRPGIQIGDVEVKKI
ncbi:MAG: glycosyltransferase [Candidatus Nanohaloarchaea archaeon]